MGSFGSRTARPRSRSRVGISKVAIRLSFSPIRDSPISPWGQSGRLIYSVRELPPNQYDSNLWEMRYDEDTGKPKGTPRRLTDWTGFYFGNPQLTADGKRFVFLNGRAQSDVYLG